MFATLWNAVMDSDQNAFLQLPKAVRFQLMVVLATLWSAIFCVGAGLIAWMPTYVFVHVALLLAGIFGTGWTFRVFKAKTRL
jgi:hypothetical protein